MWAHILNLSIAQQRKFIYNISEVILMAQTQAQLAASKKYHQEKLEEIKFRVPKGTKAVIQEHAAQCGESTNSFIYRAVQEAMTRDKK